MGPVGLFLSTQCRMLCTSCVAYSRLLSMWVLDPCHTPRRTGLRPVVEVSVRVKAMFGNWVTAYFINSLHMGPTIKPETLFSIEVLSLLPAQVPTTRFGV